MPHNEHYRLNLPHYQQPGQAYFVTWCLKDAVPAHALKRYAEKLKILKTQINGCGGFQSAAGKVVTLSVRQASESSNFTADWNRQDPGSSDSGKADSNPLHLSSGSESGAPELKHQYYSLRKKYIKAFNDFLDVQQNPKIDLSKSASTKIIANALKFWEGTKLKNHAFCIMPNHVHWVVELLENDEKGKPVYLEDILYSVKRYTATQINKLERRNGALWQKESFETTIRDDEHMYNVIEYTLNNPVNAGFVKNRDDWPGLFLAR